ncbi:HD domain-containing protein, partial [Frankia sp. ACN1ag]
MPEAAPVTTGASSPAVAPSREPRSAGDGARPAPSGPDRGSTPRDQAVREPAGPQPASRETRGAAEAPARVPAGQTGPPPAAAPADDGSPVVPRLGHESPPLPRRVRGRLSRLSTHRATPSSALDPVLRGLLANHPRADIDQVQQAFEVADAAHAGQVRFSGHPYITHPIAVASILADLGMDTPTLSAALLHDTLEETSLSAEAIRETFGDQIALIVDAVSKLNRVKVGEAAQAAQAETIRRMVVAMARDPRALVVKLADRLHNMRTLRFL